MPSSIASTVAGAAVGKLLGGSSSSGGRKAAGMADPFASQRGQYAGLLRGLYFPQTYDPYGGYLPGMAPKTAAVPRPTTDDKRSSFEKIFGEGGLLSAIIARKLSSNNVPKIGSIVSGAVPYASTPTTAGGNQYYAGGSPYFDESTGTYTGGGTTGGAPTALGRIAQLPGYQFRLDQGMKALERSAAAKGGRFRSGGMFHDITDYAQGLASTEYDKEVNRLMTLSGATVGSPGTAGQIAYSDAQSQSQGAGWLGGKIGDWFGDQIDDYSYNAGVDEGSWGGVPYGMGAYK